MSKRKSLMNTDIAIFIALTSMLGCLFIVACGYACVVCYDARLEQKRRTATRVYFIGNHEANTNPSPATTPTIVPPIRQGPFGGDDAGANRANTDSLEI